MKCIIFFSLFMSRKGTYIFCFLLVVLSPFLFFALPLHIRFQMLFMQKQQLQQSLQQRLSPQQIQIIRMLELPAIEMEERIRQELEENPALEEGREPLSDGET